MKKGDKVEIYDDPVTCLRSEGKATLVNLISRCEDYERWNVHFDGDDCGENFERMIYI